MALLQRYIVFYLLQTSSCLEPLKCILGNGRNICFCTDVWLLDDPLKVMFPYLDLRDQERSCGRQNCNDEWFGSIWLSVKETNRGWFTGLGAYELLSLIMKL